MSCEGVKCMHCGATVVPAERFCESCGSILRPFPGRQLHWKFRVPTAAMRHTSTTTAPRAAIGAPSPRATRWISTGSC